MTKYLKFIICDSFETIDFEKNSENKGIPLKRKDVMGKHYNIELPPLITNAYMHFFKFYIHMAVCVGALFFLP